MTQPPRRLPPDGPERLRVVVDRVAPGSDAGSTRFARPVAGLTAAASRSIPPLKGDGPFVPLGYTGVTGGVIPDGAVPVGADAQTDGVRSTATGWSAKALGDYAAAVGAGRAAGEASLALGYGTGADANYSVALGDGAEVDTPFEGGVAIGYNANCLNAYDIQLGSDAHTVSIWTPLYTTAGAASGKYLPIRAADGNIYLLPLYSLP